MRENALRYEVWTCRKEEKNYEIGSQEGNGRSVWSQVREQVKGPKKKWGDVIRGDIRECRVNREMMMYMGYV